MSMFKVSFIFSVLFVVFGAARGFLGNGDTFRRKVSVELNPGLAPPSSLPPGVALVHARGLGLNDTLHFLLCNRGAPALLLVHTNSTESAVQVNWPEFINRSSPGSLRVAPESSVTYSAALVFTRIWEYDDVNNTADPQTAAESSFYSPYELQNFIWSDLNATANQSGHVITLCGRENTESFANGSLCLRLSLFESAGREGAWPSLLHNSNSSQLQVWLDGAAPRGNRSRFALEFQSVGDAGFQGRVDVRSSIDDEYTPSIFKVFDWLSLPLNSSRVWGFSQWKPVAYRKPAPVFEDATPCRSSPLVSVSHVPPSALVQAYFTHQPHTHGLNISFGVDKDPVFYSDTRYISWTVLMGMGEPPADSFSTLIIIIIAVGLGTPLAIIIVGGVFVCVRKRMTQSSVYEPIN
ncbi:glycosylated lysosomal membrane protein-like [Pimephales promelas]|uniref:glycosylated lysosomal membrane protein-like n=1 Tax=Pimephales promelas TaxID=90988 RepID=UPI001955CE6B|nr:glycosylated lysosomal membrane protein-like [Pimephales promelas]KAG1929043.1 glycosylated lysosomal membrane protein [Pimephales promelas]